MTKEWLSYKIFQVDIETPCVARYKIKHQLKKPFNVLSQPSYHTSYYFHYFLKFFFQL